MYTVANSSRSPNRDCFTAPRVVGSRGWLSSLLLLLTLVVLLILLLSIVDCVAYATLAASCLASAHTRHSHHSEVASHSMVEKHPFEFSVCVETQDYGHDVVHGQHAGHCELESG